MNCVILGKHKDSDEIETLETCGNDETDYLVNEYKISFGNDWDIWWEDVSDIPIIF